MLPHSIFQTEVQFNAPIKSGHASGLIGRQSNHPQGNPALADTHIIKKHTFSGVVQAGKAFDPTTKYTYTEEQLEQGQGNWRSSGMTSSYNNIESAKSSIDNMGDYYIDTISPKVTSTTSGRSSGSTKSKSKKKSKKRSWRSRLKALRRKYKW